MNDELTPEEALLASRRERAEREALLARRKAAWASILASAYGDTVKQSDYACFHCLAKGRMTHQYHEERNHTASLDFSDVPADDRASIEYAFDHTSLWRIGYDPLVFVTQPYDFDSKTLRALQAYCDAHGLELEIDERASFWNPGECVPVVIWHRANRAKYSREEAE